MFQGVEKKLPSRWEAVGKFTEIIAETFSLFTLSMLSLALIGITKYSLPTGK